MRYKVGDKVKIIENKKSSWWFYTDIQNLVGQIVEIEEIKEDDRGMTGLSYKIKDKLNYTHCCDDTMICLSMNKRFN